MTDGISKLGRSAVEMNSSADKLKNNKSAPEATANSAAAAPRPQANDEVILSKAAETAMTAGEFDEAKVAEIKQALAEGNYPLDERRIAESFVAIESMLGGK
ncbi:flagellar biosynthesis anti-sigma factor FlgM [Gammaproteobacteria bacterium MOLA455]|jgi:negative regulator of flagellin synthesis FlgM|nr:flagellar biosynthesis anti-sigma factor FlgM [Gammaproteobacteria bacterium MOLA455]